ncbi:Mu transposase C-terminal domain-containing protein [Actinoallomurus purpureus]|uniref:Mu transposase C-terminal domain-containing protein n=1 Tax=Actinoallomurus purpureus TaxID=478114 RepID=UPI002093EEA3|nr:Mu transposase C-terminal domain-containing protein [Actinoallomurus purpureus]MCO6004032.1 Mu transposase C-terminal domain-containing protein [Actinoallomurus purpureus]
MGDTICFDGAHHVVMGLSGQVVHLVDETGEQSAVSLPHLLGDPQFEVVTSIERRGRVPQEGLLEALPKRVVEQARWWERHLIEVITGLPPNPAEGARPQTEYDPQARSLRQREEAKVAELAAGGHAVGLSTLQRLRLRYQRQGVWGLVDHRAARRTAATGRVDERVVAALRTAVVEQTDRSTGTAERLRRRMEQIIAEEHGAGVVPLPSKATFYRLLAVVSAGRHTLGSARTRRSLANRPEGPFGTLSAARPGELVQIDSTPLDVAVVLDDGVVGRVELTGMVDVATRTVAAAVLRPTTKAVDASLLLAKAMTPEPMRPGWPEALRMSRSVLPHRALTEIDQRLADAAARPVIVPESMVCDRGKVYLSRAFTSACRTLGINVYPAHPDTPTDKPIIERTLQSVGTLFCQYVAGYLGSSVERRGKNADAEAAWSLLELQALLDEWIVACWQNRPHDGLRDAAMPAKPLTPNEKYAALVAAAGYVAVPLEAEDYIELLPVKRRAINAWGVKIDHRVYDSEDFNGYRGQSSGVQAHQGRWEVHYDPYDVSRIWVRNHHDGGWLVGTWRHLRTAPVPFGDHAWDRARQLLAHRGTDPATEAEIAQAVNDLLDRAERGPTRMDKRDQRVAARTRATAEPTWPRPEPPDDLTAPAEPVEAIDDADDEPGAQVIPLGVYDARKEAENWW